MNCDCPNCRNTRPDLRNTVGLVLLVAALVALWILGAL